MDGAELRAVAASSTWLEPGYYVVKLIVSPFPIAVGMFPLGGLVWGVAGHNPFTETAGPPGILGWCVILLLLPLFRYAVAGIVTVWRRPWIRLDATGITVSGTAWRNFSYPARTYRWNDCAAFTLREIPTDDGEAVVLAECGHVDGPLVLDPQHYGDPRDLATIANAYRSAYRDAGQPSGIAHHEPIDDGACRDIHSSTEPKVLRRREAHELSSLTGAALRSAAVATTWTASRRRYGIATATWAYWAATFLLLAWMLVAERGNTADTDDPVLAIIAVFCAFLMSLTAACNLKFYRRTPRVTLDSAGITVIGTTVLPRPPRCYPWNDCGPFVHPTAERVAQCSLPSGRLRLEDIFGYPADMVTILNAYRSVHRSEELL